MQDPAVFSGSIRRNISYHDPSLSLEAIELAARLAELHEDIEQMPLGFETPIAEGGSALSGGQRQRLAIARALAHRPAILVLDEATSALDTETESRVAANLESTQPCTTIIVAHRLSTVRDADVIVAMDQGVAIERGTHAELLAADGLYAALAKDQLLERSVT